MCIVVSKVRCLKSPDVACGVCFHIAHCDLRRAQRFPQTQNRRIEFLLNFDLNSFFLGERGMFLSRRTFPGYR